MENSVDIQPATAPSLPIEPASTSKPRITRKRVGLLVLTVAFVITLMSLVVFALDKPPRTNLEVGSQQRTATETAVVVIAESDQELTDNRALATVSASPTPQTQDSDREPQAVSDLDSIEWRTFESELGFSFEYPSYWGIPREEIVGAVESQQGDSGKLYTLTFSNTQQAYGSGRSADFSAGRGGMQEDFGINSDGRSRIEAYLDIVDPGCFTMGTQNSFLALIDFTLSDKPIGGVRLFLPIVSTEVYERIKQEYDISESAIDCFEDAEVQNQFIANGDRIRSALQAKTNVDPETSANLEIFSKVASSSTILN